LDVHVEPQRCTLTGISDAAWRDKTVLLDSDWGE
jgi:hypothetical protein